MIGFACVMAAMGLWLLPGALTGPPDLVVMKLALTVGGLMMAGAVLIWSARAGFNDEMQVDLVRKELRVGQRNISGDYRLNAQVGFADIGSVFLMRSKKRGGSPLVCFCGSALRTRRWRWPLAGRSFWNRCVSGWRAISTRPRGTTSVCAICAMARKGGW